MNVNVLGKSNMWFLTGSGLVNTVVFAFILLSLGFIAGLTLSIWQFPTAVTLTLLVNFFAARQLIPGAFLPSFIRSSMIILIIIIISIYISGFFFDISADGQLYHMESAIRMLGGWNPFKKELPLDYNQAIWLNHYGKGVEDPQATIYALTKKLETTKSTNFILLAGSFCLSQSFLIRLNRFSFRKNLLFGTLLALNPVTIYQLLNTYVDGQLSSFLLCFIFVGGLIYLDANRQYLILLASILIILINIKFTALVFAAVFTIGMLIVFYVGKKRRAFRRAFIVCAIASAFSIGVVGYFPYVINTVQYHDAMYPGLKVLRKEALKFTPLSFVHKNQMSKFIISFFSHTDNLHFSTTMDPVIKSKIPFTLNKTDIFNASKPFVVFMAGMGPFFSGIFISSLLIFGYFLWRMKAWKSGLPFIITGSTILFSVLIISEGWYARYVPQLWFIPIFLLMASELYRSKVVDRIRNALYFIMLVNISFCFASFPYVYYKSAQIKYELNQLKASQQTIRVQFSYFTSNRTRFTENEIPFLEDSIPEGMAVEMANSPTKIIPPSPMPDIPKPWILKAGDQIVKRLHL